MAELASTPAPQPPRHGKPRRLRASTLWLAALVMFGFGYALVPLYRVFCEWTGINVIAAQERSGASATSVDLSRSVSVEFDANATNDLWRFRPVTSSLHVHPGELTTVVYEVANPHGYAVTAQAIPSYAPAQATAYFKKLECFCFREQRLAAHETKQMPVVFYLDPKLPKDIHTVTLSYTFFAVGSSAAALPAQAALPAASANATAPSAVRPFGRRQPDQA